MPKIETIKASEAPAPPKKMSKASADILAAVNALKKDEVLRLQPDPGKSLRGLKTSIGRIASNNNLKVETWSDAAGDFLYVRKA
jgi:hypothetical protein